MWSAWRKGVEASIEGRVHSHKTKCIARTLFLGHSPMSGLNVRHAKQD